MIGNETAAKFSSKRIKICITLLTINVEVSVNKIRCRKCVLLLAYKHFLIPVLIFPGISTKEREGPAALVANLTVIDILDMENNCMFETKPW